MKNNIREFPKSWGARWETLQSRISLVDDVFSLPHAVVFAAAKDKPVLFSAFAAADLLLTLDRRDFGPLMVSGFYGLAIMTPGAFLKARRDETGSLHIGDGNRDPA